MFAYRDNESTIADTQDKVLINNYEEGTWSVYDQRFSVFGQTTVGQNLTWDDIDETNNPSWATWDETEELWDKIGLTTDTQKTLAGDNDAFIYEINQDYDDYFVNIVAPGITQAGSAVVTTDDQAIKVGDLVSFANVVGMTEINGLVATVLAASLNSITVNVDSSNFTAWTSGGSVSKVISFQAETIPFNPWRAEGKEVYVSHVEFLLDTNNGHIRLDILLNEEQTPFKANVLVEPNTIQKARQWIAVEVNCEADFFTFRMRQESPSVQVRLTSMRIHCKPGSMTIP